MKKRLVITIYNPDVIKQLELLPRGQVSAVVEVALGQHFKSNLGQVLLENLKHRPAATHQKGDG